MESVAWELVSGSAGKRDATAKGKAKEGTKKRKKEGDDWRRKKKADRLDSKGKQRMEGQTVRKEEAVDVEGCCAPLQETSQSLRSGDGPKM